MADYTALFVSAPTLVVGCAALKIWRDSEANKKEAAGIRLLAETTAAELKSHKESQIAVNTAVMAASVEISAMRKTQLWVGDGIVKIAAKMDIPLTERPA